MLAVLAERIVLTGAGTIEVAWRDASGLSSSVASVRPELAARLASFTPPAPPSRERAADATERTRTRAAKRSPAVAKPAA